MTDFPYDGQLIADPVTFQRATNAQVYVYDAADTTNSTPLALKDATGLPTSNPLTSSADAFVKPIYAPSQDIKYVGAGLTVFVSSAKGMRDAAAASAEAAQTAADSATTAAGNTVASASVNGAGELVIQKASGATVNAGLVKGAKGDKGDTGAPGLNGSNMLPTDDAIEQAILGSGTKTKAALSATILNTVPKPDMFGKLPKPFWIAHRGGPTRYPEQSMEGFRAAAQSGFLMELDPLVLADGTIVLHHDATTGRTLTGTDVQLNTLTRAGYLARRIKPAIPGGEYAMPVLWDDFLAEMGGRGIPLVHLQQTVSADVNARVLQSIVDRRLEKCVMIQSFDYNHVLLAKSMGMPVQFLTNLAGDADMAQWHADGIDYIGPDFGMPSSHFTRLVTNGFKVIPFSVNTYAQAQTAIGYGVFGICADDPWALSTQYVVRKRDPYTNGVRWIGSGGYDATYDSLVPLADGSTAYRIRASSGGLRQVEQGWAGALPAKSLTMDFTMQFGAEGASTQTARLFLSDTQRTAGDENQANWLLVLIRRNGTASILKRTASGSVTTIATATWASLTLADGVMGTAKRFQLAVNAAGDVTFKCIDSGDTITAMDSAALMGTNPKWLSLGSTGADAYFSKFVLTYQ